MKIVNSTLYKAVAPFLPEAHQREFARMLQLVVGARLGAATINAAFTWSNTPQGHQYWESLSCRLFRAGSPAGSHWADEHFEGKDFRP